MEVGGGVSRRKQVARRRADWIQSDLRRSARTAQREKQPEGPRAFRLMAPSELLYSTPYVDGLSGGNTH